MSFNDSLISNVFDLVGNWATALPQLASQAAHASQAVSRIESAWSSFNKIALGGAIALGTDQIINLNKRLEDTKYQLAGSIGAAGFAKDFSDNMLLAENSMRQIRKEAASLPGTDQDFLTSFSMAMPALKEAGMTDLSAMVTLSDKLTAIAKSQGVDSGQAGRDIMQMARGHAGADVRTFMALKSSMGVTGPEDFNKLSAKERLKKLNKAVDAYSGLLANFDQTWEAIASTAESYGKNLMLAATGPMFDRMKGGLAKIEKMYGRYQDEILFQAEYVSNRLLDITQDAFAQIRVAMGEKNVRLSGGDMMAATEFGPTRADMVRAPQGSTPDQWMINLAAMGSILSDTFSVLMVPLEATKDMFVNLGSMLMELVGPILPPLMFFFQGLAVVASAVWTALMGVASFVFNSFKPALSVVGNIIGAFFTVLGVGFNLLGNAMMEGVQFWRDTLNPVLERAYHGLQQLAEFLNKWLRTDAFLKEVSSDTGNKGMNALTMTGKLEAYIAESMRLMDARAAKSVKEEQDKKRAEELAGQAKKAKPVTNVTNNNKFDIKQEFAPGFDPDRIITTLKRDIAQLAARRDQSGLTPLFVPQ